MIKRPACVCVCVCCPACFFHDIILQAFLTAMAHKASSALELRKSEHQSFSAFSNQQHKSSCLQWRRYDLSNRTVTANTNPCDKHRLKGWELQTATNVFQTKSCLSKFSPPPPSPAHTHLNTRTHSCYLSTPQSLRASSYSTVLTVTLPLLSLLFSFPSACVCARGAVRSVIFVVFCFCCTCAELQLPCLSFHVSGSIHSLSLEGRT